MHNRHGFLPNEADRLLETISENWNAEIGNAEQRRPDALTGHSRRQLQAVMAAMVNLQSAYSYSEIIRLLLRQIATNEMLVVYHKNNQAVKESYLQNNMLLQQLVLTFSFLQANTYQL